MAIISKNIKLSKLIEVIMPVLNRDLSKELCGLNKEYLEAQLITALGGRAAFRAFCDVAARHGRDGAARS